MATQYSSILLFYWNTCSLHFWKKTQAFLFQKSPEATWNVLKIVTQLIISCMQVLIYEVTPLHAFWNMILTFK